MKLAPRHNAVPWELPGLTIALQYYAGDEAAALRLARLLADIEPRHRENVTLAFCRRFDCQETHALAETMLHCGRKFSVCAIRSQRMDVGHPDGCNGLWSGVAEAFAASWARGHLKRPSVFFIEPDGVPLREDWLNLLIAEQQASIETGKRVTGALTRFPAPHFNGSLIMHVSAWVDRPSLHATPPGEAWDIHHAAALMQEGRATQLVKNAYGGEAWSAQALDALAAETAWLSNTKDASALEWAERTLVRGYRFELPAYGCDDNSVCPACLPGAFPP